MNSSQNVENRLDDLEAWIINTHAWEEELREAVLCLAQEVRALGSNLRDEASSILLMVQEQGCASICSSETDCIRVLGAIATVLRSGEHGLRHWCARCLGAIATSQPRAFQMISQASRAGILSSLDECVNLGLDPSAAGSIRSICQIEDIPSDNN